MSYDLDKIRSDFPILNKEIRGKRLVFLDSAASAQKPLCVVDKIRDMYLNDYANVHRGLYYLSESSTYIYENSRKIVKKFLNAIHEDNIVFTRNATESINLVAYSYARVRLTKGDEIIISEAEHHANLLPWQVLRNEIGIVLKIAKVEDDGSFELNSLRSLMSEKVKLVSMPHVSNVLGTIFPVKEICKIAHEYGAKALIDGCQGAVHLPVDVQDIDCDFYVFSGHKTYGPTGIGVLYGKKDVLESMVPYQVGGDMVKKVTYEKATYADVPSRFEAGTPAFIQAVGLGEALEYMMNIGMDEISKHELELVDYAREKLYGLDYIIPVGNAKDKGGVFSFVVKDIHSQDIATILDQQSIAVRTGHHCAEPLVHRMGYETVVRASFGLYSGKDDVDALVKGLDKARSFFI